MNNRPPARYDSVAVLGIASLNMMAASDTAAFPSAAGRAAHSWRARALQTAFTGYLNIEGIWVNFTGIQPW